MESNIATRMHIELRIAEEGKITDEFRTFSIIIGINIWV